MLYEMVGIARAGSMSELRDILRSVGMSIITSGGVVRRVDFMGRQFLPRVTGKYQQLHIAGHHFLVAFDSSPRVQHDILQYLLVDPRMLNISIVNNGKRLPQLARPIIPGKPM
ncbi:uncharacterized protein V1516DRAFT_668880 [Lipomyces oligophaga]|uniref:uncharacterized protein n=1 Tax=Lipomyces oligophaga TaxID=45792 RepID=UPI0034CE61FF